SEASRSNHIIYAKHHQSSRTDTRAHFAHAGRAYRLRLGFQTEEKPRDRPASGGFARNLGVCEPDRAHAEDWKQKDAIGLVVFSKPPAAGMPKNLPPEIITGTDAGGRS